MKIDNVHFEIENCPPELQGKTINEVFDAVKEKANPIIKRMKTGDMSLTPEELWYLQMAQLIKNLAHGDMTGVKLGIKSPLSP